VYLPVNIHIDGIKKEKNYSFSGKSCLMTREKKRGTIWGDTQLKKGS